MIVPFDAFTMMDDLRSKLACSVMSGSSAA